MKSKCPFPCNEGCPSRCKSLHRTSDEHWCYDFKYNLPAEIIREEDTTKNVNDMHDKIQHLPADLNGVKCIRIKPIGYLKDEDLEIS